MMPIVVPSMLIQRLAPGARKSLQGGGSTGPLTSEFPEIPLPPDERKSPFNFPLQFAVLILGNRSLQQRELCDLQFLPQYKTNFTSLELKGSLHSPCGSPKIFAIPNLYLKYTLRPLLDEI